MTARAVLARCGQILGLVLLCAGCNMPGIKATGTKKATSPTGKDPIELTIESHNGSVTVICEPELDEMQVEAEIVCRGDTQQQADERLEQSELIVAGNSDGQFKVSVQFQQPRRNSEGANVTVRVPALDSAIIMTSNGAVQLDASKSAVNGSLQVETSNGGIQVQRVSGDVNLKTSNGSMTIVDVGGKVDVHSSNGSAKLTLLDGQQGPVQCKTSNASIQMAVAKDFHGVIKADTSNASVSLDDPNKIATRSDLGKSHAEVVMGGGEQESTLKTSNGSIKITVGD